MADDFRSQWERAAADDSALAFDITPAGPTKGRPVILAPGWGGGPEMYKNNLAALVHLGRRTLCPKLAWAHADPLSESSRELPGAQQGRVASLINALDYHGVTRADAIGHSEGGLDVILAASAFPASFQNLVLVDPAGFTSPETGSKLAARFLADATHSLIDATRDPALVRPWLRAAASLTAAAARHPVHSTREIKSMARAQITELLGALRKEGIRICIIHAVDDGTFPMAAFQQTVTGDMVDGFVSVKGRHGQFQLQPVPYTRLAALALDAMDVLKAKSAR